MSGTDYLLTPKLGLYKPVTDADVDQWGSHLNLNADRLDSSVLYDARGNVGIGITPPAGQAATTVAEGGWLFAWGVSTNNVPDESVYYNGTGWSHRIAKPGSLFQQFDGNFMWLNAPTGAADTVAPMTQRMLLDAAGKLTLNTGGADIHGVTSIIGADAARLEGGGSYAIWRYNNTLRRWWAGNTDIGSFVFYDDSAPRTVMTLQTDGNVVFGAGAYAQHLYSYGTGSVASGIVYRSFSPGNTIGFGWDGGNACVNYYIDGIFQNTIASRGWANAVFKPIGAYTPNQNVDYNIAGVVFGRMRATNGVMSDNGVFYVANNDAYYLARNSTNGNWYFTENNQWNFLVRPAGDTETRGVSYATHQFSRGNVYIMNSWERYFGGGGSGVILQFQASWYFDFNVSTGDMQWVTPSGAAFAIDGSRNAQFHGGSVYINGSRLGLQTNCIGVAYSSGAYATNNTFLFGWSNVVGSLVTASIDNGGAVYALANASDERLKLDVQPSTFDALATVNRIPLVAYDWLDMGNDTWGLKRARARGARSKVTARSRIGVVAQRVREVFPEGVYAGDDFDDHLGRVWGLDQNVMIALLIGAVQQLTERLTEQEARA